MQVQNTLYRSDHPPAKEQNQDDLEDGNLCDELIITCTSCFMNTRKTPRYWFWHESWIFSPLHAVEAVENEWKQSFEPSLYNLRKLLATSNFLTNQHSLQPHRRSFLVKHFQLPSIEDCLAQKSTKALRLEKQSRPRTAAGRSCKDKKTRLSAQYFSITLYCPAHPYLPSSEPSTMSAESSQTSNLQKEIDKEIDALDLLLKDINKKVSPFSLRPAP